MEGPSLSRLQFPDTPVSVDFAADGSTQVTLGRARFEFGMPVLHVVRLSDGEVVGRFRAPVDGWTRKTSFMARRKWKAAGLSVVETCDMVGIGVGPEGTCGSGRTFVITDKASPLEPTYTAAISIPVAEITPSGALRPRVPTLVNSDFSRHFGPRGAEIMSPARPITTAVGFGMRAVSTPALALTLRH